MAEAEPRRSVRATKGQHKALEQLDLPAEAPKRRGGKKGKKAAAQEEPEEEIIRCVCGATEQDDHSDEAWIACDSCGAWQHNVCMGMSQFEEDLDRDYFCEQCRPENHKELLESMARGERLWELRRKNHEEEAETKKKRKGGKKGKGKRMSDAKEETPRKGKQSPSTTPVPSTEPRKESVKPTGGAKRKAQESQDKEPKSQKMRKVSDSHAVPVPAYTPPSDLAAKITDLPEARQGPIKALGKSLAHAIGVAEKNGDYTPPEGSTITEMVERYALQVERAVHDTHPNSSAYISQVRTLTYNIKSNQDLCDQLLAGTLTPPMLATMTTEELASKELKKETAEMKARAEKQAIKITDTEDVPRIRRTHKGDEVIPDDALQTSEITPGPSVRRQSQAEHKQPTPGSSRPSTLPRDPTQPGKDLRLDIKHSPSTQDFDINKVFSSVRSPSVSQNRRASAAFPPVGGPGEDADVDRLLDDGGSSPPYSPTEDSDPDVIWRGHLMMNTVANLSATAKHIAGCDLTKTIGVSWNELILPNLAIAGRIDEEKAITYLCGLRFSEPTDIVVAALSPATSAGRAEVQALVDYFVPKKKYGVVSDRGHNNVRDTYLVPVLPGEGNHPEFLLNLEDNHLPMSRTEPVLLLVIVYRNDPETMERLRLAKEAATGLESDAAIAFPPPSTAPPGPTDANHRPSISGPAFSPATPQGAFPGYPPQTATPSQAQLKSPTPPAPVSPGQLARQQQGELEARDVLGDLVNCPTAVFILPQAYRMVRAEWEIIRAIYLRDPITREDLRHFSSVLDKESEQRSAKNTQPNTGARQYQNGIQPPSQVWPPALPGTMQQAPPAQAHFASPPAGVPQQTMAPPQGQPPAAISPAAASAVPSPLPQQVPAAVPPVRNTPIPPPPIPPHAMSHSHVPPPAAASPGVPRQTPIPPPAIPPPGPQAMAPGPAAVPAPAPAPGPSS